MLLPATYEFALFLMILSMLCWGSWANTLKLCPGYRFQLFYWDYAIGLMLATVVWGFTAGSLGHTGPSFVDAVTHTPSGAILFALAGGVVFNIANPLLLFGGVALVTVAIVLDAAAYRKRESTAKATTTRGIMLSLVAGVLMGGWYPIATHNLSRDTGPGPYAIAFFFAIGVVLSTIPANLLLMAKPLDGKPPVDGAGYWRAPFGWHLAGIFGGAIWCVGAVANFIASVAHLAKPIGPAVSYSIGQGATMISAFWGVFIWREFAGAPKAARLLLLFMFIFFLAGLSAVALAPLY